MRSEKFLISAIILLAALALTVPLFVTSHLVMGLVFIKTTAFQILVILMAVCYLLLLAQNPVRYSPRITLLTWAVFSLALALSLATVFSSQPFISFWGDSQRMAGLYTYLHYFAFLLVLQWTLKTKNQWLGLLKWALGVGIVVGLYSLAQLLDLHFVRDPAGERITGPMSNALTLAQYGLLLFFPAATYFVRTKRVGLKLFLGTAAIALLGVVFLAESEGAYLALLSGATVWLIVSALAMKKRYGQIVGLSLLGIWIVGTILAWGNLQGFLHAKTAQTRLSAWEISLEAAKSEPLVGYGLENFSLAYQKHYQPFVEKFDDTDPETWFDRAHNSFLDYLVMAGILGVMTYLAVLLSSIRTLFNTQRPKWSKAFTPAFAGLLTSYIVFNFFAFDVISASIPFWFLLAMMDSRKESAQTRKQWVSGKKVLGTVLAALLFLSIWIPVNATLANRQAGRGLVNLGRSDFATAQANLDASLAKKSYINSGIAAKYLELGGAMVGKQTPLTIEQFVKLADYYQTHRPQPFNGQYDFILGNYYLALAGQDPAYLDGALAAYARSDELAPRRPLTHLVWGSALLRFGQSQASVDHFQTAVALMPEKASSHFWLALGLISMGQREAGEAALTKAHELGYKPREVQLQYLKNIYLQAKSAPAVNPYGI